MRRMALLLVAVIARSNAEQLTCKNGTNFPGNDIRGSNPALLPLPGGAGACKRPCVGHAKCNAYVFHLKGCSQHGEHCAGAGGCCFLKTGATTEAFNACMCSEVLHGPPPPPGPPPVPSMPSVQCAAPPTSVAMPPPRARGPFFMSWWTILSAYRTRTVSAEDGLCEERRTARTRPTSIRVSGNIPWTLPLFQRGPPRP